MENIQVTFRIFWSYFFRFCPILWFLFYAPLFLSRNEMLDLLDLKNYTNFIGFPEFFVNFTKLIYQSFCLGLEHIRLLFWLYYDFIAWI